MGTPAPAEALSLTPRQKQLAQLKQRALDEVSAGNLAGGVSSIIGDLSKGDLFPDLKYDPMTLAAVSQAGMMEVMTGDAEKVNAWINGFN